MEKRLNRYWTWSFAFAGIVAVSVSIFLVTFFIDAADQPGASLAALVFSPQANGAMSNMPEVIAGILGIAITVVAIVVELAANRYTPRITELFVESPANLGVLGFFVVTGLMCIWISMTGQSPQFTSKTGTTVTLFAITICMLLLLPYFAFVFRFLSPHNIVDRMRGAALVAIRQGGSGNQLLRGKAKKMAVRGVEQLSDVALNSIEHKDKGICMHAIDALGDLTREYLGMKDRMPKSWFKLDLSLRENPDFISMQDDVISDIERDRCWFEMKVLRQYQMIYGETLNKMRDINYLIAINTRKIAEQAMAEGKRETISLAMKFFNTFLRATINDRDVRTAYNVLNQYRLITEAALRNGFHDVAMEAAKRFKYYGQLGFAADLPFVLETAAYDLCTLNEIAFDLNAPCRDSMLSVFLELDKEAEEGHNLEASLRGVRKAQIKLVTYYLIRDAEELARIIFNDMKGELKSRLDSIRDELLGITSKDFWEISDRGVNFDYLEPNRRAVLTKFFSWFDKA